MELYKLNKNSLEFKKFPIMSWIILYTCVIIAIVKLLHSPTVIYSNEKFPVNSETINCDLSTIEETLAKLNVRHKDVVLAQIIVETGNLTSPIFKENNNLFGMKEAKSRPTTALGTQRNHAYYISWKESIVDYALWQSSFARGLSKDEYISYLGQVYAEDSSYTKKIYKLIGKNG